MSIEAMKQVKVFLKSGDNDVALLFTWDGQAWVCKMDDDFMRELGPLPFDRENDVSCNLMLTSKSVGFKKTEGEKRCSTVSVINAANAGALGRLAPAPAHSRIDGSG